jgi:hypothetical protein
MNPNHELWNERHKELRVILRNPEEFDRAVPILLDQHAMVNSAEMSGSGLWSFEDEIWGGLTDEQTRTIPEKEIHSIAWLIWHMARIEDITMNSLVGGGEQVFLSGGWREKLGANIVHTGNEMDEDAVRSLSANVHMEMLKPYRIAVSRRTREVIRGLKAEDMKKKVPPERLNRLIPEGWLLPGAVEVLEYWSGLDIAGFLLMPPTRHCFIHLNEAVDIKKKLM